MKKIILLFAFISLICSCTSPVKEEVTQASADSSKVDSAFASCDSASCDSACTDTTLKK